MKYPIIIEYEGLELVSIVYKKNQQKSIIDILKNFDFDEREIIKSHIITDDGSDLFTIYFLIDPQIFWVVRLMIQDEKIVFDVPIFSDPSGVFFICTKEREKIISNYFNGMGRIETEYKNPTIQIVRYLKWFLKKMYEPVSIDNYKNYFSVNDELINDYVENSKKFGKNFLSVCVTLKTLNPLRVDFVEK